MGGSHQNNTQTNRLYVKLNLTHSENQNHKITNPEVSSICAVNQITDFTVSMTMQCPINTDDVVGSSSTRSSNIL